MDSRDALPVVVFDGDDTLWETEQLHDEVRRSCADVVARSGLKPDLWTEFQYTMEDESRLTGVPAKVRFPASCVGAYYELARLAGHPIEPAVSETIRITAETVWTAPARVRPDARSALESLQSSFRLVLVGDGDGAIQAFRLKTSRLAPLFDRVETVEAKSADYLSGLLASLGAKPAETWVVGDSLEEDVLPAIGCGARAILIDLQPWEFSPGELERAGNPPVAPSLTKAARLLLESPIPTAN